MPLSLQTMPMHMLMTADESDANASAVKASAEDASTNANGSVDDNASVNDGR